jgi:hypothetical protein
MPFILKTLNAFEMTHRVAACEIPAKNADHRAFVGIYPPMVDKRVPQWRITRFEIPSKLVLQNFGQEDLVEFQSLRRDSLEEIEDILRSWGIASSLFDAPWKCDWPL